MYQNAISLILLFLCLSFSNAQTGTDYCNKYKIILNTFNENFIQPEKYKEINQEEFIKDFINSLDPYQIILSKEHLQKLSNTKNELEIDYNNAYCICINSITSVYKSGLENFLEALNNIEVTGLDFNLNDSLDISNSYNLEYFNQNTQTRLRNYLKYKILGNLFESYSNPDSIIEDKTLLQAELVSLTTNIIKKERKKVEDILQTEGKLQEQLFTLYVNSVLAQMDPHSNYFPKENFEDFQAHLSSSSRSFGIQLETNQKEKFIISSIVPGSYAWKTGKINVGNEIVALNIENKEPLNLEYAEFEDIIDYIESSDSDMLTVTIINNVGKEEAIVLFKEDVNDKHNVVQSYLLSGKRRVGYILLPAFYTSWEQGNYFGCAQDVAKAIYELKKENIESLILDLRDNGGGSLKEAIELAGIFIDFGTMSIEKDRNNELASIKDFNRGTMYSGPMAILVNENSASASEMVAAVLQDYNRAVIIGTSTFGKASGQTLFPILGDKSKSIGLDNNDVLKITNSKFYRVTGSSYQKLGVEPDIKLPHIIIPGSYAEANFRSALNNDSVSKKTYYKPLVKAPISRLQNESSKRIVNNPGFIGMKEINNSLGTFYARYKYVPLNINQFQQYYSDKKSVLDKFSKLDERTNENIKIEFLKSEKEMSDLFKYYKDLHESIIRSIQSDPYIEETYYILNDLLTFSNK